jgi:3,2-trans-enoyl-CoA isomerase
LWLGLVELIPRGFILASSNQKVFSAGLDIMEMYQPQPAKITKFWTSLQDLYLRLYTTRLAAVAAIEGHSPAEAACWPCAATTAS